MLLAQQQKHLPLCTAPSLIGYLPRYHMEFKKKCAKLCYCTVLPTYNCFYCSRQSFIGYSFRKFKPLYVLYEDSMLKPLSEEMFKSACLPLSLS